MRISSIGLVLVDVVSASPLALPHAQFLKHLSMHVLLLTRTSTISLKAINEQTLQQSVESNRHLNMLLQLFDIW